MQREVSGLPIRFENVGVKKSGVTILDDISLQIEAGAPTVLIGPNGSGKTTVLRIAMGLDVPSQGRVTWAGVGKLPPTRRAFVFQRPVLLRRSVDGNLRYALNAACVPTKQHDRRLAELKALVGLDGLGLRPARGLSGGELQRLALARALALAPAILFLDEPTTNLDPASTKKIEDVIRSSAASGIKIVMSTHDLGQARRLAGEVLLLHRGRVIERGSPTQLFNAPLTREARTFVAGDLLL